MSNEIIFDNGNKIIFTSSRQSGKSSFYNKIYGLPFNTFYADESPFLNRGDLYYKDGILKC